MSPLQEIEGHPGAAAGIRLFVKRDDLLHPVIHGNKWRKLQPLLQRVQTDEIQGILSFGGPFSNHLHALAGAGQLFGVPTVGIVRGLAADLDNPTLRYARACGMQLRPVPKKDYDLKTESPLVQEIIAQYPAYFVLNEGGMHPFAIESCKAIADEICEQVYAGSEKSPLSASSPAAPLPAPPPITPLLASSPTNFLGTLPKVNVDHTAFNAKENILIYGNLIICIPSGTGCTALGVAEGLKGRGAAYAFPAAPYGGVFDLSLPENLRIETDYIFGKFAAMPPELQGFVEKFESETGILLDPVYTAKMMYGIYDKLAKGHFETDSMIVAVHTGGLQGRRVAPIPDRRIDSRPT